MFGTTIKAMFASIFNRKTKTIRKVPPPIGKTWY